MTWKLSGTVSPEIEDRSDHLQAVRSPDPGTDLTDYELHHRKDRYTVDPWPVRTGHV